MKSLLGRFSVKLNTELAAVPIEEGPKPEVVTIPLTGGNGYNVTVEAGTKVKAGSRIAEAIDEAGADIHASVSGEVASVASTFGPDGLTMDSVVIKADPDDEWEAAGADAAFMDKPVEELWKALRAAGVVSYGTRMTPVADPGSPINTLIVSALDEDPLVGVSQRILRDKGEAIGEGIALFAKLLGTKKICLVTSPNQFGEAQTTIKGAEAIEFISLTPNYPATMPEILIRRITGLEVPQRGTAADIGVAVLKVETLVAAVEALKTGRPVVEKTITVTDNNLTSPKHLKVRIGTPIKDVLAHCGMNADVGKAIIGGPFLGRAQFDLNVPIAKESDALLVQSEKEVAKLADQVCINCGRCVPVCPVGLMPNLLSRYCEYDRYDDAESVTDLWACIECGLCAYVCPSRRPMTHFFQYAKSQIEKIEQSKSEEPQ